MAAEGTGIDVIIPVYNGQKYIEHAVHSALKQTLLPSNLIIVNDGSTDDTRQIIERLKAETITSVNIIIINQENKGVSAARNAGIKSGSSPFLAFLDSDDCWLPEKLQKQVELFKRTEFANAGLVYCNYEVIDDKSNVDLSAEIISVRHGVRGKVFDKITRGNVISGSGSGVMLKRSCLGKTGLFDEKLRAYEDWDMWLRIAQEFEFDYTEEVILQIRQHPFNMQKDLIHMNRNGLLFYKKWLPFVGDKETLRQWAFRIAKPVYVNGFNREYLAVIRSVFSGAELNKLYSKTFGSIGLYILLKRMSQRNQRSKNE